MIKRDDVKSHVQLYEEDGGVWLKITRGHGPDGPPIVDMEVTDILEPVLVEGGLMMLARHKGWSGDRTITKGQHIIERAAQHVYNLKGVPRG